MSNERPWNAQDKAKWREIDSMTPADLVKRCFDAEIKLDRIAEIARRAISGDEAGRGDAEGNYAQGQIDLGRAIQDALK